MDPNPDAIKEDLNRFRNSFCEKFNKVQKVNSHFLIHLSVFQLEYK